MSTAVIPHYCPVHRRSGGNSDSSPKFTFQLRGLSQFTNLIWRKSAWCGLIIRSSTTLMAIPEVLLQEIIFLWFSHFPRGWREEKNIFLGKNIIKTMMNCKQSPLEMFFEIGISSFMLKLAQTTNLQDQVIYGATWRRQLRFGVFTKTGLEVISESWKLHHRKFHPYHE